MTHNYGESDISWDSFWSRVDLEKYVASRTCHDRLYARYLANWIGQVKLPLRKNKIVLEIGAAYSKNLWLLPASAGRNVLFLGLDSCLEPALKTGKSNPYTNVRFIVGNLLSSPVRSRSVDMIYSSGVVEHLRRPEEFFLACRELLRPGGRLVAGYPSFAGLTGKVQRAVNPGVFNYHFSLPCAEMAGKLSSCGFSEVEARSLGPFNPNMIDWGQGLLRRILMYAAFSAVRPLEWLCRLTGASLDCGSFSSYIVATGIKPASNL